MTSLFLFFFLSLSLFLSLPLKCTVVHIIILELLLSIPNAQVPSPNFAYRDSLLLYVYAWGTLIIPVISNQMTLFSLL